MKKKIVFLILLVLTIFSSHVFSQSGANDSTFNTYDKGFGFGDGANSKVMSSTIQNDGKIIIGGNFTAFNGTTRGYLARLNQDGSLDTSFNTTIGADGYVGAIAIQTDGKILIGGYFSTYNGITRNYLARLNTDGSLDATFNNGIGANSEIKTIAIQNDGKILIGGAFTTYNGLSKRYFTRLNTDGSLDATFNTGSGANYVVYSISIQNDDKIIIGGYFTSYSGTTRKYIARINLDGSIDNSFSPIIGADNYISSTTIQSDGKILIGGAFSNYNGTSRKCIARINTDGSLDSTFNVGSSVNYIVNSISIQSNEKIIIGGSFDTYNGFNANRIARLNTNGNIDTTFNHETGVNSTIYTTSIQSDGKILIGGLFTSFNSTSKKYITRLNNNGTLDFSFNSGTGADNIVYSTKIQSDGKIIIGGDFTSFNGKAINRLARLNTNGNLDTTFNIGLGANDSIWAITIQNDGKILIGGRFTYFNGIFRNKIARINIDGTLDTTFNTSGVGANKIYSIAIQSNGKIIIGGDFVNYNGTDMHAIVRLNSNGSLDNTFNTTTATLYQSRINTISIQSDGKIIIGGNFADISGTRISRIKRLNMDGSLDATFNIGSWGVSDLFFSSAIQSDGKILIGSNFTYYHSTAKNRLVRLNFNGSVDTTFNIGLGANNYIRSISIQNDGKIIIGGDFTTFDGENRNCIARLNSNGSLDSSFNVGIGTNYNVLSTAIQSDEKIIISGKFTSYNGIGRNRIARTTNYPPIINVQPLNSNICLGDSCNFNFEASGIGLNYQWQFSSDNGVTFNDITSSGSNPTYTGFATNSLSLINLIASNNGYVYRCIVSNGNLPNAITNQVKVNITTSVPLQASEIIGDTIICKVQNSVMYTVDTISNTSSYVWTLPNGAIGSSITNNIVVNFGTSSTSGSITVHGENACGIGANSILPIIVNNKPTTPIITLTGNNILQSSSISGNQWHDQNGLIIGATTQNFTVIDNGVYYVIVSLNGCVSDTSNVINIINTSSDYYEVEKSINIYPIPFSSELIIEYFGNENISYFEIINSIGQIVYKGSIIQKSLVQTSSFPSGVYLIKFENSLKKIIKE